jgi:hypothetical protein
MSYVNGWFIVPPDICMYVCVCVCVCVCSCACVCVCVCGNFLTSAHQCKGQFYQPWWKDDDRQRGPKAQCGWYSHFLSFILEVIVLIHSLIWMGFSVFLQNQWVPCFPSHVVAELSVSHLLPNNSCYHPNDCTVATTDRIHSVPTQMS